MWSPEKIEKPKYQVDYSKMEYRWKGYCEIHGLWDNDYKDGCVYEQWEEERHLRGRKQLKIV